MADERDLQLLDDYLTNRMGEHDHTAFEQKIQADPDLQHEYILQQRLIKGIKDARVAQLKSMLNQVPIPANNTGSALASKIVVGAVLAIMAVATVWYFTRENAPPAQEKTLSEQQVTPEQPAAGKTDPAIQEETARKNAEVPQKQIVESDKNQTSAGTEHSKPSLAKKPDPLQAPKAKSEEPVKEQAEGIDPATGASNNNENHAISSGLVVETDRENARYTFHYQFKDGKVILYGPFENSLYHVIRLSMNGKQRVFLQYKDSYYALDSADANIRPLVAVTDAALLRNLQENGSK